MPTLLHAPYYMQYLLKHLVLWQSDPQDRLVMQTQSCPPSPTSRSTCNNCCRSQAMPFASGWLLAIHSRQRCPRPAVNKLTTIHRSLLGVSRGHADSVNSVAWQPYSGSLATASADKSVCLWDARSGLPTLKLYGHAASCNCLAFMPQVSLAWGRTHKAQIEEAVCMLQGSCSLSLSIRAQSRAICARSTHP